MSRRGELIKQLASGDKAVSVSAFNSLPKIHIRRYYGESDKKFPTRYGITMTKQEFVDLVSLSNVVLTEFERLESKKTYKAGVEPVTITETSLTPDVVPDTPCYDDNATVPYDAVDNAPSNSADETPFAIGDISTLASQPQYSHNDRSVSLETPWGAPAVTDPTYPQSFPWNINDDWSYCHSQVPDSDEQIIPDVSAPTVPVPVVPAPAVPVPAVAVPVVSTTQRIPVVVKRRAQKPLNLMVKKLRL